VASIVRNWKKIYYSQMSRFLDDTIAGESRDKLIEQWDERALLAEEQCRQRLSHSQTDCCSCERLFYKNTHAHRAEAAFSSGRLVALGSRSWQREQLFFFNGFGRKTMATFLLGDDCSYSKNQNAWKINIGSVSEKTARWRQRYFCNLL